MTLPTTLAAGWFEEWERDVLHLITCRWHSDGLARVLDFVQVWRVGVVFLLLGVLLVAAHSRPRALRALLAAALGVGAALGLGTLLWRAVGRERPPQVYERLLKTPEEKADCARHPKALAMHSPGAKAPSFPSHHGLAAGVFATCLWLAWRPIGVLGWVFALLVGFGRLHAGKHWPSDVLAGFLIGALLGWLAWRLVPVALRRAGRERWVADPPVTDGTPG